MTRTAIELDSSVGTMERGSINRSVSFTLMPEQEAYRPQAEHTAEQPQSRATPEAGATQTRPENEVAANPRILALMQERDAAERRLQEAILDLETREQSPAFQKAKELFESGWQLQDLEGYEGFRHYEVVSPDQKVTEVTYVKQHDGIPRLVDGEEDIFAMLDILNDQKGAEVLRYLNALTEEKK